MESANRWAALRRALPVLLCAALAVTLAAPLARARADEPSESDTVAEEGEHPAFATLRKTRTALEEMRYPDVQSLLDSVPPDAPPLARVQGLELRAVWLIVAENSEARAQPVLEELYFRAPAWILDNASGRHPPRVSKLFEEEAARPHKRGVTIELQPVDGDLRGFSLRAGGASVRIELSCRTQSKGPFLPVGTQQVQAGARFRLPNEGAFECHAVAFDRDQLPLGRLGLPGAPVTIRSRKPPPPPPNQTVFDTWWFWTITSTVVVGGVIASVAVATSGAEPPEADLTVTAQPENGVTILRW